MSIQDEFTIVVDGNGDGVTPKRLVGHGIDIPVTRDDLVQLYFEVQSMLGMMAIMETRPDKPLTDEELVCATAARLSAEAIGVKRQ